MTTLPPTTNWPNALTTLPALPVDRISRVTDTLIASRNIVVSSSRLGKTENSSGLRRYIVATTIARPPEMFMRDQQVEERRRQRHDQHRHDHDDGERRHQVGVLQQPCGAWLSLIRRASSWPQAGRRTRAPAPPPRTARPGSSARSRPCGAAHARAADRARSGRRAPRRSGGSGRHQVLALGDDDRRRQRAVVAERHGEVGRVGDHDVRLRDRGHHPCAGRLDLAPAQRALDLRRQLVAAWLSSLTSCLDIFSDFS